MTEQLSEPTPINAAIGARVRQLREAAGADREQLARACQRVRAGWGGDRIAHIEAGRASSATLPNLVTLAQGLSEVLGRPVTLPELLPAHGALLLAEGRTMHAGSLRQALAGAPVPPLAAPAIDTISDPRMDPGWGQVDDRLVADLAAPPELVRSITRELYGHSATVERDKRAGSGATPQKRGRITRVLIAEVTAEVNRQMAQGDY